MRLVAMAALFVALPAAVHAQAACGPLQMVNTLSLVRSSNGAQDYVPILFDAGQKYFLFDTGGARTQISAFTAESMNLELHDGTSVMQDITGRSVAKMVHINEFVLGHLKSDGTYFPIAPLSPNADGIFALDYLLTYDADVDFGTDTLNFFSPNHCPGYVVYWQAPAVAELPMKVDSDFHIMVSVEIDGQQFDALIDSGSTETTLRGDVAESKLHLTLGDADTPASGNLNCVASLATYRHIFKNLTFGDVAVVNPHVVIIPAIQPGRIAGQIQSRRQLAPLGPEVIIGMDVLRKLHLYMAFKENKLYISAASDKPPAPFPAAYFAANIARLTDETVHAAQNPVIWSNRCFWRGVAKTEMDAALGDCEQSLKLKPDNPDAL